MRDKEDKRELGEEGSWRKRERVRRKGESKEREEKEREMLKERERKYNTLLHFCSIENERKAHDATVA